MARDAAPILRERRRTRAALIALDTVERLTVHAYAAIDAGDTREAKRLLEAVTAETTAATGALVGSKRLADDVTANARARVDAVGVFRLAVARRRA